MDTVEVTFCTAAENINLAFYQNAIPIIRELSVSNATGAELRDASVHLSSEPHFITPSVWRIDRIAKDDVHHLKTVDLKLDQAFLSGLTASRRAEILLGVVSSGRRAARRAQGRGQSPSTQPLGRIHAPPLNSSRRALCGQPIRASTSSCAKPQTSYQKPAATLRSMATRPERRRALGSLPRRFGRPSWATRSRTCSPPKSFERQGQMVRQ